MNSQLHKPNPKYPMGITILAIWALVGGCVIIGVGIVKLAQYHGNLDVALSAMSPVAVPLGATYTTFNGYTSIAFGIALAAIGIFTFRGGRMIWATNIGISILALASLAYVSYPFFYNMSQPGSSNSLAGLDNQTTNVIEIVSGMAIISVSAIRLHYLLRRDTRNFFNKRPQQTLAPDAT
jgi:hypothetical protein